MSQLTQITIRGEYRRAVRIHNLGYNRNVDICEIYSYDTMILKYKCNKKEMEMILQRKFISFLSM